MMFLSAGLPRSRCSLVQKRFEYIIKPYSLLINLISAKRLDTLPTSFFVVREKNHGIVPLMTFTNICSG